MKGAFKIFTVRGINVSIHWTFIFLILWLLYINGVSGGTANQFLWSVIFVLAIFVCVILHELGHALVAARYNIRTKSITLLPIGGIANMERIPEKAGQELAISIAGPLVNVAIALILIPFIPQYIFSDVSPEKAAAFINSKNFLYNLHLVNVWLVLFNLIPAFPMDGGRILRALLGLRMDYLRATTIAAATGKIIAWLFILAGLFTFNIFLGVIGLFVILSARAEEYYLRLKLLIKGIRLKNVLMRNYRTLPATAAVKDISAELLDDNSKYFVVMENDSPIGTVSRAALMKAISEDRDYERLSMLMEKDVNQFDGDKEVDSIFDSLLRNSEQIFPVMENNKITGVVSLQHIIEYLLIQKTVRGFRPHALIGFLK